eukprot:NODE_15819_length_160_cov_6.315315_g14659_i0.p2 GENE.NODE_15819_length_160_cov_6.315315_g14659_i0~~NODE_15819_length_160_cov_6.315315_g14659_i0.p2  ORF type:complete len:52 (-),score=55.36 NODE_15819_length_160_cov_6.315315_g14659_i0:5-130(-)
MGKQETDRKTQENEAIKATMGAEIETLRTEKKKKKKKKTLR